MAKVKPGYKLVKSLFGKYEEIPEEWDVKYLGTISELYVPMRDKPKRFDGDIPWLRIEDLDGKYANDSKLNQRVSSEIVKNMNLKIYPIGTVLCSCSATIGVCAITTVELITNQTFIGIKPTKELNEEFLFYYLLTKTDHLKAIGTGSTILYISREKFEKLPILLPKLIEQLKIASILSSFDELIAFYDKTIEITKKLKTGLMQTLLTQGIGHKKFQKTEYGDLPLEWSIVKLDDCKKKESSICYGILKAGETQIEGIPYIRPTDMKEGGILKEKLLRTSKEVDQEFIRTKLKTGDIILSVKGTIGKIQIISKELEGCNVNRDIAKISIKDNIDTDFLFYILKSNFIHNQLSKFVKGSTIKEITMKSLRNLKIPLPSFKEQKKIGTHLKTIDNKLLELKSKKRLIKSIKKGLMQKLLTGQIRVTTKT